MKRITLILFMLCLFLISACSLQPTPIATPTQPPIPTTAPKPFTGKLFFDMNGSGLQDESSFVYDPERLADPRQPLQPDLDKAIKDYVAAHPNLKNGDLVTISEPGLSGYKVCIDQQCATTSSDGRFSISNSAGSTNPLLKITDPYAGKLALAMRFINAWNGPIVIPAYEMNGVKIPNQQINDTKVTPIENGIYLTSKKENIIGLMQGFLTFPYEKESEIKVYLSTYFDLDPKFGKVLNFLENRKKSDCNLDVVVNGTCDNHNGIDYVMPEGTLIIASSSGTVNYADSLSTGALQVTLDHVMGKRRFQSGYGHLSRILVSIKSEIVRGQIIGLSGKTGVLYKHPEGTYEHLHFALYDSTDCCREGTSPPDIDPYRNIGNNISIVFWTVDNLPQFPFVG